MRLDPYYLGIVSVRDRPREGERERACAEVSQYSYSVEDHLNIQSSTFIMIAIIPTMQHMYRRHKTAHYNIVYITPSILRLCGLSVL